VLSSVVPVPKQDQNYGRARHVTSNPLVRHPQQRHKSRLHHVAVDADGEIEVFDIWESPEALQKWGPEGFVPILIDLGVELHPPTIHPVHNVIPG